MSVDLDQAKAQCRVTHSHEDGLIEQFMKAARAHIERLTGIRLEAGEVVDTFTRFGDYLQLTAAPFISLASISYLDSEGEEQAVTGAAVRDGRVYAPAAGWPALPAHGEVTVTYQAGYAETPADLDMALLLLIGHWYNNREAVSERPMSEVPLAVQALVGPYKRLVLA